MRRWLRALRHLVFGDAVQRRRVRQEMARALASLLGGFVVEEDHKLWREDREFLADYRRLSPGNPYSQERKYLLREMVRFTRDVPGVMAECGSFEGATAYFMAREAPDTPLHLFDSLEGLSEIGDEDVVPSWKRSFWRRGTFATDGSKLRRNLAGFDQVTIHQGWIPERFPDVAGETFRLVHVDVDLYRPTLDSIAFFYPRLAPGGVMVFDDYGYRTCPGAHRAVEEFMADKPEHVIHVPTGQGVIIRRSEGGGEETAEAGAPPQPAKKAATESTT